MTEFEKTQEFGMLANEDHYTEIWASLRLTYDNLITEDNEIELMDKICEMYQNHLNKHFGTIKELNAGIDWWSAKEGMEKSDDGDFKVMLYVGDDCKHHGHIHVRIGNLHQGVLNKINSKKDDFNVTSKFKRESKWFWDSVKELKILPEEWWSRFNKMAITYNTKLKRENPELFLSYPLKEIEKHKRDGNIDCLSFSKKWTTWDDSTFDLWKFKRCSKFDDDCIVSQKKKASALAKDTNSWAQKLATWIEKHTDVYTQEKIDPLVLEFYERNMVKFSVMDIAKDRNLFLAIHNQDERRKLLVKIEELY